MSRRFHVSILAIVLFLGCSVSSKDVLAPVSVSAVTLNQQSANLVVGQSVQLAATAVDGAGATLSGRSITWASASTTIATVSQAGTVVGVAPGTTTISASSEGKVGIATVTVSNIPVAAVSVQPSITALVVGQTTQLTVIAKDASGAALTGRAATFTSDNLAVASVSSAGIVSAVASGNATVLVTVDGVTTSARVAVSPAIQPAAAVSLLPAQMLLTVGDSSTLRPVVTDAGGNTLTGRASTWSSSNTAVASVSASGTVLAVSAGTTRVSCTVEGKVGYSDVTVTAAVQAVASISITPPNATLLANGFVQMTANPVDAQGRTVSGTTVSWTSSSPNVATITATGLVSALSAGATVITASAGGKSATAVITVNPVVAAVASVAVTPATATITVGQSQQLSATAKDASANVLSGRTTTWSSSNTTVATVSSVGLVTAAAAGTSTISATVDGVSGTTVVTVTPVPVATVTLTPSSSSLTVGQTQQLSATAKDASSNILGGRTVTWSSSATSIATVSSAGLVTAVAAGSATITATSEGVSSTASVTVSAAVVPVASVAVSPSSVSLIVGQTQQLSALAKDASANALSGRTVTWATSAASIATVTPSGLLTALSAGTATVTATVEGVSGSATVTISATQVPVASVTVSPTSSSLTVGQTQQLGVVTKDAASNILAGRSVTWSSGNSSVATVSSTGLVTAVAAGTATITATSEGIAGASNVTVNSASNTVSNIEVYPGGALYVVGDTGTFFFIPKKADGSVYIPPAGFGVTASGPYYGMGQTSCGPEGCYQKVSGQNLASGSSPQCGKLTEVSGAATTMAAGGDYNMCVVSNVADSLHIDLRTPSGGADVNLSYGFYAYLYIFGNGSSMAAANVQVTVTAGNADITRGITTVGTLSVPNQSFFVTPRSAGTITVQARLKKSDGTYWTASQTFVAK
jgi:uncharacterized protein YjdB